MITTIFLIIVLAILIFIVNFLTKASRIVDENEEEDKFDFENLNENGEEESTDQVEKRGNLDSNYNNITVNGPTLLRSNNDANIRTQASIKKK